MGFLEEGHRCPRGVFSRLGEALLTLLIGAAVGIALCYAIEDRPVAPLAAAAAVLASAVRQPIAPNQVQARNGPEGRYKAGTGRYSYGRILSLASFRTYATR
jgi:hypothetical protein